MNIPSSTPLPELQMIGKLALLPQQNRQEGFVLTSFCSTAFLAT
jgi:hypothetical protein